MVFLQFCVACYRNKLPLKVLLLLDYAPEHLDDEKELLVETKDSLIEVIFLPRNTTLLIKQPLGQIVIKMMKTRYKKRFLMDIVSIPAHSDIKAVLKKVNIKNVVLNAAYS